MTQGPDGERMYAKNRTVFSDIGINTQGSAHCYPNRLAVAC